jgi:TonB family protein
MSHRTASKKVCGLALLVLALLAAHPLQAARRLVIKFRTYEGVTGGKAVPVETAGSGIAGLSFSGRLPAGAEAADERARIEGTLNVGEVRLTAEADLIIGEGGQAPDRVRHVFELGRRSYQVVLFITEFKPPIRLFTVLLVRAGGGFDSVFGETIGMEGGATVLVLEDVAGTPYVLTFRITGPPELVPRQAPPPPPPPMALGEEDEGFKSFAKGAVEIGLALVPPRLVRMIEPALPPEAPAPGPGAHVSLYVRIDEQGRVVGVRPVYSSDKRLEPPAMAAVRQWAYEPYVEDGRPRQAVIPVNIRFWPD